MRLHFRLHPFFDYINNLSLVSLTTSQVSALKKMDAELFTRKVTRSSFHQRTVCFNMFRNRCYLPYAIIVKKCSKIYKLWPFFYRSQEILVKKTKKLLFFHIFSRKPNMYSIYLTQQRWFLVLTFYFKFVKWIFSRSLFQNRL